MSFTVSLDMTQALEAKLRDLARAAAEDAAVLDDAAETAGWLVANRAKELAPYKTGTLRRDIRVERVGPGDVRVGASVAYARRIEMGFIGTDALGRDYHQAAQPYLRPALDEMREQVQREMVEAARELVRRKVA